MNSHQAFKTALRTTAQPLRGNTDLAPLIDSLKDKKIVMLGEASHGTHEFYELRRVISEALIEKHGFNFVAVEGDWPPCWRLGEFVSKGTGRSAREVLRTFNRWPTWMWANTEIVRLANALRSYNESNSSEPVQFYGLDVYSLFESIDAVVSDLANGQPDLANKIKCRYECFERYDCDERAYAKSLLTNPPGCERQVTESLRELLAVREPALFSTVQNARIVANAESYYRAMVFGHEESWNVRDRHMCETLGELLELHGPQAKAIVWAHNTHIGDYRATDMVDYGQINLGGLAREQWGEASVALVGFGTHRGTVIASHAWDGPVEMMRVPPAQPESLEACLHEIAVERGLKNLALIMPPDAPEAAALSMVHGHRAIGVVYQPNSERRGNYVPTALARRYDAFLFVDQSSALEPLQQTFDRRELPETWPTGQ